MRHTFATVSVAAKKGTKMAVRWSSTRRAVQSEPFPLIRKGCSERTGAVKGSALLARPQRTLDGEDRSETISEEGKAGRKVGEKWSAILVSTPAASNTPLTTHSVRGVGRCESWPLRAVVSRVWLATKARARRILARRSRALSTCFRHHDALVP